MLEKTLMLNRLSTLYGGLLTDKQKEALELYYNCDMSLAEIADELDISRQGVRDCITRAERTLNDAESKLGLLARMDNLSAKLSDISDKVTGEQREALLEVIRELEE